MAKRKQKEDSLVAVTGNDCDGLFTVVSGLLDRARTATARVVNGLMTATYYELGRRIVEFEQGGKSKAGYGEELMVRLTADLTAKFGRGFSRRNLEQMRVFYLGWEVLSPGVGSGQIRIKASDVEKAQTPSALLVPVPLPGVNEMLFPLPWSHYVRLMTVPNLPARRFYEEEAIQGGWSVRQLNRQISTQFYERLSGSKRKGELLAKAHVAQPEDTITPDQLVRDPYVLEFLNLTDEYGEGELEGAIIRNLEAFLVELGRGFTFVARQRKIRIDAQWYKMDLRLFHRRLRCLVVIDLKIGSFSKGTRHAHRTRHPGARREDRHPHRRPPRPRPQARRNADRRVRRHSLLVRSYDTVIQETQDYFRQFTAGGASVVDELIADRRLEAAREDAEVNEVVTRTGRD